MLHGHGGRMSYEPEIMSLRLSELARQGKLERTAARPKPSALLS